MGATMTKIDLRKELRDLYTASTGTFEIVDVPTLRFLAIDGEGDPNVASSYAQAVEALYAASYAVKFASKRQGRDFVVAPLEGLWTADDPAAFTRGRKADWRWTMMLMQPDWVTPETIVQTIDELAAKKKLPALELVSQRELTEGLSVQILHVGSYDDEAPTLERLHREFLPAHGFAFNGPHHEIYLSDPRRTAPAKLKTILRQPVCHSS
jgi:hypothetical protein